MSGGPAFGDVQPALLGGLLQGHGPGARLGPAPPRPAGTGRAAPAPVDDEPVHRVGRRVQGRAHGRQGAERLPRGVIAEQHFQDDPRPVLVPGPLQDAVGEGRLDQRVLVGILPPPGREVGMEDLD